MKKDTRGARELGSKGHDYKRSADDTSASSFSSYDIEAEVDHMLAQRLAARLTGDYVRADNIRDELFAKGVAINDKMKVRIQKC